MTRGNTAGGARRFRHGLTLIETVVAVLITGILVIGSLRTVGYTFRTQVELNQSAFAEHLTDQLLAEILCLPLTHPLPAGVSGDSDSPRSHLTSVGAVHGWRASPLQDVDGNVLEGTEGWERSVIIRPLSVEQRSGGLMAARDTTVEVVVTVRAPSGLTATRSGWASVVNSRLQPPPYAAPMTPESPADRWVMP